MCIHTGLTNEFVELATPLASTNEMTVIRVQSIRRPTTNIDFPCNSLKNKTQAVVCILTETLM